MSAPNYLDDDCYLAEYLAIAKRKFEDGDKAALLKAMHQCLLLKKPMPEWLRVAFIEAFQSAIAFEIRNWDEAFGPPQEKGAHFESRKQRSELRYPIALRVALRAPGENIDKGLFEVIGKEHGISASTADDIYYKHGGKELSDMIEPLLPWLKSQKSNPEKK